jgi:hypothetical protein
MSRCLLFFSLPSPVSAGKPKPGAKSNPKIIPFARFLLDHRAFISHGKRDEENETARAGRGPGNKGKTKKKRRLHGRSSSRLVQIIGTC